MTTSDREASALDDLYWRAEILQALFWMRGEGIAEAVEAEVLAEFLRGERVEVAGQLDRLRADGYLEPEPLAGGRQGYRLTSLGHAEGARSFRDEFEAVTASVGHYACAPGCSCEDPDHADEDCPTRTVAPDPRRVGSAAR